MSKSFDDELPASTLGGAADKYVVQRIDGRYVPVEPPGPLHIAARPAPDIDPEKLAAFKNESGPPSIVQTIIGEETYEHIVWRDPKPLLKRNPPAVLTQVRDQFVAIHAAELRLIERREMSADDAVAALKKRYRDLEHSAAYQAGLEEEAKQRVQGFFDAGELITADALCSKLDISPLELEQAVTEQRMFSVPGPNDETWYPAFFADSNHADIERISVALGELSGPEKWDFFTTEKISLCGNTPLIALQFVDGFGEQAWFGYVFNTAARFRSYTLGLDR